MYSFGASAIFYVCSKVVDLDPEVNKAEYKTIEL